VEADLVRPAIVPRESGAAVLVHLSKARWVGQAKVPIELNQVADDPGIIVSIDDRNSLTRAVKPQLIEAIGVANLRWRISGEKVPGFEAFDAQSAALLSHQHLPELLGSTAFRSTPPREAPLRSTSGITPKIGRKNLKKKTASGALSNFITRN